MALSKIALILLILRHRAVTRDSKQNGSDKEFLGNQKFGAFFPEFSIGQINCNAKFLFKEGTVAVQLQLTR